MGNLNYFELIHNELVLISESDCIKNIDFSFHKKRKILKLIFKSHHLLSNMEKNLTEKFNFFQYVESFIEEIKKELI